MTKVLFTIILGVIAIAIAFYDYKDFSKKKKIPKIKTIILVLTILSIVLGTTTDIFFSESDNEQILNGQSSILANQDTMQCSIDTLGMYINASLTSQKYRDLAAQQAKCLEKIVKNGIDSAIVAIGLGNFRTAELHLYYALTAETLDTTKLSLIYFYKGVISHFENKLIMAAVCYSRALSHRPQFANTWNNIGDIFYRMSDFQRSSLYFERATQLNSGIHFHWANLGNSLAAENKDEQAIKCYDRALQLMPFDKTSLINISELYRKKGDIRRSLEMLNRLLLGWPCDAMAYHNIGNIYIELGILDSAIHNFGMALKCDSDVIGVNYELGIICDMRREFKKAIKYYKKELSRNPYDISALINTGCDYDDLYEFDSAKTYYRKALAINPLHYGALCDIGVTFLKTHELDSAYFYYDLAIRINKIDYIAYHGLSEAYIKNNDYKNAEYYLKLSVDKGLPKVNQYASMSGIYIIQGFYDSALTYIERTRSIDTYMEGALFNQIFVLVKLEQLRKAGFICDTALAYYPYNREIQKICERIKN